MEKIIAVERNHLGDIISFKTSNGRVISYRKALLDIETGVIDGVEVVENERKEEDLSFSIIDNFDNYPPIY
ncbi:DUF3892 domain-containing protein [Cytobacillus oceanisediminis]|uniref:DUF3892 domain-containing protein n=2 Tax=Niallia TaxID=2837506 RepID=A0A941JMW4_NIACI|nr:MULTISPECIES: DUF3892 domain-containing protein [Bacillaceae]MBQ6449125.1 DUF3892 domain-containing protein [Bacillus sp. (in: firmicutes)]MDU1844431.1 DUF3892 domain-containing protein [Niallia nealsonii]MBZ9534201.1 DUF3892 domain-containing protein [Cytobacillus oceanisediminis]MCB5238823.1 DUF3892 domain-containing protein [Niallia circulans]MED3795721.1 DUF3892 domain-containing protein [Niallia alba]